MLAFSFLVPNKHTTGRVLPFMCCCLSVDKNLNVFSAAERSDIAENEALFLRLGLLSTLIRHENVALLLRLGLPSTLQA